MSNDQFSPLIEGEEEPRSLGDVIKSYILYYNSFKTITIYNIQGISGERFIHTLMKLVSDPDGLKYLNYLQERRAYTVNVASYHLGLDVNKLYPYTKAFVNMGVLMKVGKLGKGERGFPTFIYALRDASQTSIDDAAQLYKDITSSHVNSMDEYLIDYDYNLLAEELIRDHLISEDTIGSYSVAQALLRKKMKIEQHRDNMYRILQSMGYTIRQGE